MICLILFQHHRFCSFFFDVFVSHHSFRIFQLTQRLRSSLGSASASQSSLSAIRRDESHPTFFFVARELHPIFRGPGLPTWKKKTRLVTFDLFLVFFSTKMAFQPKCLSKRHTVSYHKMLANIFKLFWDTEQILQTKPKKKNQRMKYRRPLKPRHSRTHRFTALATVSALAASA